jgi:hypothetical protein
MDRYRYRYRSLFGVVASYVWKVCVWKVCYVYASFRYKVGIFRHKVDLFRRIAGLFGLSHTCFMHHSCAQQQSAAAAAAAEERMREVELRVQRQAEERVRLFEEAGAAKLEEMEEEIEKKKSEWEEEVAKARAEVNAATGRIEEKERAATNVEGQVDFLTPLPFASIALCS